MSDFESEITQAVADGLTLDDIVRLLRLYRDSGMTQRAAKERLEQLRDKADDAQEDRILEILDIVTGFCQPGLRVWPSNGGDTLPTTSTKS